MRALSALGLHIGINGCSLRTEEGLEVARHVPAHLLLLETDAPWCGIKPTHAGHSRVSTFFPTVKRDKKVAGVLVKDRNEPCTLLQVLEVVASVRECEPEDLATQVRANTYALFVDLKLLSIGKHGAHTRHVVELSSSRTSIFTSSRSDGA
eukprot:gene24307-30628_t